LWNAFGLLLPGVGNQQMGPVVVEVERAGDEEARFDVPRHPSTRILQKFAVDTMSH
jgi:hypothetical protein